MRGLGVAAMRLVYKVESKLGRLGLFEVVGFDGLIHIGAQLLPGVGFGDDILAKGLGDEPAIRFLRNLKDQFAHRMNIR